MVAYGWKVSGEAVEAAYKYLLVWQSIKDTDPPPASPCTTTNVSFDPYVSSSDVLEVLVIQK